MKQTDMAGL